MGDVDAFFNGIEKVLGKGESMASRAWTSYSGDKYVTPQSVGNAAAGTVGVLAQTAGAVLKAPLGVAGAALGIDPTLLMWIAGGVLVVWALKK